MPPLSDCCHERSFSASIAGRRRPRRRSGRRAGVRLDLLQRHAEDWEGEARHPRQPREGGARVAGRSAAGVQDGARAVPAHRAGRGRVARGKVQEAERGAPGQRGSRQEGQGSHRRRPRRLEGPVQGVERRAGEVRGSGAPPGERAGAARDEATHRRADCVHGQGPCAGRAGPATAARPRAVPQAQPQRPRLGALTKELGTVRTGVDELVADMQRSIAEADVHADMERDEAGEGRAK